MKTAAGFVIFKKAQNRILYLLLQTSYGEHHWTPPKGHVDPGETDEMVTALRETSEESGLEQKDLKIFQDAKKVLQYNVKGKPKRVIYWLAELITTAEVKLSDEHQDFKWLGLEEACNISKYQEMQETLRFFDSYIVTNGLNINCSCK